MQKWRAVCSMRLLGGLLGGLIGIALFGMIVDGVPPAFGAEVEKGRRLYEEKRCGLCHAVGGKGGKLGPDLSNVGGQRDRDWLMKFMKDPKGTMPGAKMMAVQATEDEIAALADYMASLK